MMPYFRTLFFKHAPPLVVL